VLKKEREDGGEGGEGGRGEGEEGAGREKRERGERPTLRVHISRPNREGERARDL